MTNTPAAPRSDGAHQQQRKPFLNVKEAAEQLRLDESTLYRHLREGRFPGVKVGGRYLVPTAVIEELAAGAMAAGHCVDIDEWAARWRDERAAAIGEVSARGPASGSPAYGRYSREGRR